MSALFDIRTLGDFIAYPIRFVLGDGARSYDTREHASRPPLILRWRRGDDGKLEGRWNSGE
jgi:hypothetical protein